MCALLFGDLTQGLTFKVKALLRGAEARTPADLITATGQALARVTAQDALGWLVSCGYRFC